MFCALCAADNPNDGHFCVKCGAVLQGQRGMPPPGLGLNDSVAPYTGPTESSGKAVASLICGILFFIFPSAIAAIILGHLSISDIRRSGGRLTGHGMATAGLVLGYMGIAVIPVVLIVAAIAIPNLLRARMAANESSAVGSLRTINAAAFSYQATYSNGFPPGLEAMDGSSLEKSSCDHAQLIDPTLASGQKSGYTFTYGWVLPKDAASQTPSPAAAANGCTLVGGISYQVYADPITRGTTGQRGFYTDQTAVVRFAANETATEQSPPLQ
jgi:type IV pilus assembly protein PilA